MPLDGGNSRHSMKQGSDTKCGALLPLGLAPSALLDGAGSVLWGEAHPPPWSAGTEPGGEQIQRPVGPYYRLFPEPLHTQTPYLDGSFSI